MNEKIKRKWCAALRGGTWKQFKSYYSQGENLRCALGVLVEVVSPGTDGFAHVISELRNTGELSFGKRVMIESMNDNEGKTFNEIADWIEESL